MLTIEQFRASGRNVADLGPILSDDCFDGSPGRVYLSSFYICGTEGDWNLILERDEYQGDLRDLEVRLYDWVVTQSGHDESERDLVCELKMFCEQEKLPHLSACELIHEDLTDEQRRYVSNYIIRWDAMEAAEQRAECKRNGHRDTGRGVCANCGDAL
jgi:hypothetical protein